MRQRVILKLGQGSLKTGFPTTIAQLWLESSSAPIQVIGGLGAASELEALYQRWQEYYTALQTNFGFRRNQQSIEFDPEDNAITQISVEEFEQLCIQLKCKFNQWLNTQSFNKIERWLRTNLSTDDQIQFILEVEDPQAYRFPWHLWNFFEDYPHAEFSLSTLEYRPIKLPMQASRQKVRVLAILGHSAGIEIKQDQALLQQFKQAETTFLTEPTRAEFDRYLWDEKGWDILFFAGHSSSHDSGKAGQMVLNPSETLSIGQLKNALRSAIAQGLQLAIFNSCEGLGLAREFADLSIPQLIVMRELVPDKVAQAFLFHFLSTFAKGETLYASVRQARQRLQGLESQFPCASWLPVICQNPAVMCPSWSLLQGVAEPQREALNDAQPGRLAKAQLVLPLIKQLTQVGVVGLAVTGLLLTVRHLGWLQPLELKTYDHLLNLRPQEPPDSRLLIIEVTEADVRAQRNEQPRGSLSETSLQKLLTLLQEHDPAAIGLDIYRDYPARNEALAEQLQTSDRLVAVCRISQPEVMGVDPPPEVELDRQGFSDGLVDPDQVVRRHLLAASPPADSPCSTSYAFSTQLALRYLADRDVYLEQLDNGEWQLGHTRIRPLDNRQGSYQTVDTWGYQMLLNYRSHRSIDALAPRVSLSEVLAGKLQTDMISDRIILIGTTAESFGDYATTPYSTESPGVILQAQMVSQLLSATLDGRSLLWIPPWWGDLLWIVAWSVIGGGLTTRLGHRSAPILLIGIGGSLALHYGVCLIVLVQVGGWLALVPGSLGLLGSAGLVWLVERSRSELSSQSQLRAPPSIGEWH